MAILTGAFVIAVVVMGTALLSGYPLPLLAAGLAVGGGILFATRRPAASGVVAGRGTAGRRAAWIARVKGHPTAALTFGAVGLFIFNIVFGPIAVALGIAALRRDTTSRQGRVAAWLGIVLGVADVVLLVVMVLLRSRTGAFGWQVG